MTGLQWFDHIIQKPNCILPIFGAYDWFGVVNDSFIEMILLYQQMISLRVTEDFYVIFYIIGFFRGNQYFIFHKIHKKSTPCTGYFQTPYFFYKVSPHRNKGLFTRGKIQNCGNMAFVKIGRASCRERV